MPIDIAAVEIRNAARTDLEPLARFLAPFVEDGWILPRTIDELEDLLPNSFVADYAGRIVGFCALEIYSKKLAEIRSLGVLPELQGKGVGKRLVEACVERARSERIFEVMVITSSEAIFRACGFDFSLPGEKKALFLQTRDNH